MKQISGLCIALLIAAVGCSGSNGVNGTDGQSVALTTEPAGANCANGGVKAQVGTNALTYVCNGPDGANAVVAAEPSGANCATGGVSVTVGSGSPTYVCSGAAGTNGTNGQSAVVTAVAAGANCANGGVSVAVGSGTATYVCNGAPGSDGQSVIITTATISNCSNGGVGLQVGASGTVSYVCNGATGAPGQSVTITAAGSNCQYGGVELQVGSGTPSYVCNGAPGTNGPCAVDTAPIINAFTMSAGLPYTATVNVAYGGTGTLDFYFDGDAGTFTQTTFTNPYAFNFVPDESGGPYNFNATVTDGCLLAMKSLTGIYTPPADVSGVTATPGAYSIALTWTNPTNANFDHVEITCSGTCAGFSTKDVASPSTATTVSGLTAGQLYGLTLEAMDAHGSRSAGIQTSVMATGWLSDYSYRRIVRIDGSSNSSALTDYQVLVTLDTASLISNSKLQSNCNDIRFTDSDGAAQINYWLEPDCNTNSTNIWVKVPSIAATSQKTIYVYYGKSDAVSSSNGDNTFIFFDDFSTAWNSPVKWTGDVSFGSVSNGVLSYGLGYDYEDRHITGNIFAGSKDVVGRMRAKIPSGRRGSVGLQNAAASGADWAAIFMIEYYTEVWSGNYGSGAGSGSEGGPVSNWTAGEFKTWDVIVNGGVGTRFYEDGVELTGSPLTTNVPNDYLSALVYSSDANTVYVDWILTRKYAAPEPAVALGTEQHP